MADLRDKIPREFFHGDSHPEATTVGELITQLKRLPADLRLCYDEFAVKVLVVYNIDKPNVHLDIEEAD